VVGVLSVAVVVGVLTMRPTVILLPEEDLLRVRCAAYSLALSGGASAVAVVGSAVREAIDDPKLKRKIKILFHKNITVKKLGL
jgi:hypothetical protein